MSHEQLLVLVELYPFHDRVIDPKQPSPYPCVAHAVPLPLTGYELDTRNRRQGTACRASGALNHPRKRQESPK